MRAGGAELVCVQTSCIRCAEGGGRWCVCGGGGRFCACLFYWSPRDWWWAIHGTSRQILPASACLGHSESEWLALPNDSQTCAQRWQRMCPLGQRAQGPSAATQEGGGVCGELSDGEHCLACRRPQQPDAVQEGEGGPPPWPSCVSASGLPTFPSFEKRQV